ncbi:MAG TPA: class I SAM-dependent methyltransferase [Acidobacteriota bacterium]|nr:class I SAM-dependent methyltransferase [Acidobacteriota bacterium]HQM62489.1 class I SAM-dependent methyltransferase [Acidobacteriota bacterium]
MSRVNRHPPPHAVGPDAYDAEAEATGWRGPEIAFDLMHPYLEPGQAVLEIGIGTGLAAMLFHKAGLVVHGLDLDPTMLTACRRKGFTHLIRHDLRHLPYPYPARSMHGVVCVGVFQFFRRLGPVFREVGRILRPDGSFVFVVGDRTSYEATSWVVEAELAHVGRPVTMFRHSGRQITGWLTPAGFVVLNQVAFTVYMDRAHTRTFPVRAYLARRLGIPDPA